MHCATARTKTYPPAVTEKAPDALEHSGPYKNGNDEPFVHVTQARLEPARRGRSSMPGALRFRDSPPTQSLELLIFVIAHRRGPGLN